MADPEVRYLGDLQRLSLEPGDKLVLSVDAVLSTEQRKHLHDLLTRAVGEDVPVIVLERGMKLGVVSTEAKG